MTQSPNRWNQEVSKKGKAEKEDDWNRGDCERKKKVGELSLRPENWDSNLVKFAEFAEAVDVHTTTALSPFKAVVLVKDLDEAQTVGAIIFGLTHAAVVCVEICKDGPRKVPFKDADAPGAPRFMSVTLHNAQSGGVAYPRIKGLGSTTPETIRTADDSTMVLRLGVRRDMIDAGEWAKLRSGGARKWIVDWIRRIGMHNAYQDSWDYDEEDDEQESGGRRFIAKIRIKRSARDEMLVKSGHGRVILDAIRSKDPNMPDYHLDWKERIPGVSLQDAIDSAYQDGAKYGVTIGKRQIATRREKRSDDVVSKSWQVEGLPRSWSDDVVLRLLGRWTPLIDPDIP